MKGREGAGRDFRLQESARRQDNKNGLPHALSVLTPTVFDGEGIAVLGSWIGVANDIAAALKIAREHGYGSATLDTTYGGRRYVCLPAALDETLWGLGGVDIRDDEVAP